MRAVVAEGVVRVVVAAAPEAVARVDDEGPLDPEEAAVAADAHAEPVRKSSSEFGAPTSWLDRICSFLDETGAAGPHSTPVEESSSKRVASTHIESTLNL